MKASIIYYGLYYSIGGKILKEPSDEVKFKRYSAVVLITSGSTLIALPMLDNMRRLWAVLKRSGV
jgi:hypothetical protein